MTAKRIDCLGLPLDVGVTADTVCDLLRKKSGLQLVTFINPAAWALARKDALYADALNKMSLVLADGFAVVLAARKLLQKDCHRVSFDMTSLADPFFKTLVEKKMSVMLIGGAPGVADNVQTKLQTNYSGLKVVDTSHGFGDFESKIAAIKSKKPDAIVVAMGAPRQEAFLMELSRSGYKGMAITCGGFFDQYMAMDGTQYYPKWIDRWNLRFLYRIYKEPGRLWRRYLIDYQLFFIQAAKALLSIGTGQGRSLLSRPSTKRT